MQISYTDLVRRRSRAASNDSQENRELFKSVLKMEVEEDNEGNAKRPKRKPNFTAPERMHLAKSYVENISEYNRGFTSATRGDAKHGRQLLLEKWAAELTAFGVAERTTIEVEQKLRDYAKKIVSNNKKPLKRPLSPAADLLSTVLPQCSSSNTSTATNEESSGATTNGDPQTQYAEFLLGQHRAASNESVENRCSMDEPNGSVAAAVLPPMDFSVQIDDTVRLQFELLQQQVENARTDGLLKKTLLETARIEQNIKRVELEQKRVELQRLRHDRMGEILARKHVNGIVPDGNANNELTHSQTFD